MSEFRYKDILNMQYPNPEIEKDFSDQILRAAQFAPFAALTGYDDAVEETARLTDCRNELDEHTKSIINERLRYIIDSDTAEIVSITYFVPDEKKAGGKYVTKTGAVYKIKEFERLVIMEDGSEIPVDEIFYIEGNQFDDIEIF